MLSCLYGPTLASGDVTTGKIIALTIRTFVGKVMSLLFNTVFRFVIAVLPRSKRLLISWLQSPSTLLKMSIIHSFLWLGNISLYMYIFLLLFNLLVMLNLLNPWTTAHQALLSEFYSDLCP